MLFVYVLLILAFMVAASTLLTKGTVALMGKLGGETIYLMHSSAEYIVRQHSVPPAWQLKLGRRLRGLRADCAEPRKAAAHRSRAKRACLRQLGKLIDHFRRTSLVVDEEARAILVSELAQVHEEWQGRSWDEMSSPGGGSVTTQEEEGLDG